MGFLGGGQEPTAQRPKESPANGLAASHSFQNEMLSVWLSQANDCANKPTAPAQGFSSAAHVLPIVLPQAGMRTRDLGEPCGAAASQALTYEVTMRPDRAYVPGMVKVRLLLDIHPAHARCSLALLGRQKKARSGQQACLHVSAQAGAVHRIHQEDNITLVSQCSHCLATNHAAKSGFCQAWLRGYSKPQPHMGLGLFSEWLTPMQ